VAVLTATIAALIARSWLQVQLVDSGMPTALAADVSYLLVPPTLLMLLFPLWHSEKTFLKFQFRREALNRRTICTATAIGVLIHLVWWSQLIVRASFGVLESQTLDAVVGPVISFHCAPLAVVALGFIVMAILVPLIEEITYRGYVQTVLERRGVIAAIFLSAAIFTIFHARSSWPFSFFGGVVLGTQFWVTRSLWPSVIAHGTVNALVQIDLKCLSVIWNPRPDVLPAWLPGAVSLSVFVAAVAGLFLLLRNLSATARGARRGRTGL
jgi:membrane protease YdiL (CAAX protease family)